MKKTIIRFDYNLQSRRVYIYSSELNELKTSFVTVEGLEFKSETNLIEIKLHIFLTHKDHINAFLDTPIYDIEETDAFKTVIKTLQDQGLPSTDTKVTEKEVSKKLEEEGFARKLRDFQMRNLLTLINTNSFADFSVPGTGKTTVALAYFFYKKKSEDKLLVVAPRTTFMAWEDELKECLNKEISFLEIIGNHTQVEKKLFNDAEILIISYNKLRTTTPQGRTTDQLADFIVRHEKQNKSTFIVLDESHKIKAGHNATGKAAELLRSCQLRQDHKLLLTGTPMPQGIQDLEPQFNFVDFNQQKNLQEMFLNFKNRFVRTTKSEINLKAKNTNYIDVPMSDAQQRLYDSIESATRAHYKEDMSMRLASALNDLQRYFMLMLQVASNPALLLRKRFDILQESATSEDKKGILTKSNNFFQEVLIEGASKKMLYACDLTRELVSQNKKVVIWSGFVSTIEEMCDLLGDVGAVYIHGGIDPSLDEERPDTRKAIINKFHKDDKCNVLIANPASCAEGISLHKAAHEAIYLDRNYTLTLYLQSVDRIHRLGLDAKQDTNIYILESPNTIDKKIRESLDRKETAMNHFLETRDLSKLENLEFETPDSNIANEDMMEVDSSDIEDFFEGK